MKIKELQLCCNCLKPGHFVSNCTSIKCKFCKASHHTSLHISTEQSSQREKAEPNNNHETHLEDNKHLEVISTQNYHNACNSEILLSTAIIDIQDKFGQVFQCRALLDSASQSNFITEALHTKLKFPVNNVKIPVNSINNAQSHINIKSRSIIQSRNDRYCQDISFLVVNTIARELPTQLIETGTWNLPPNITLADPHFNISSGIDILLGAEVFFKILQPEQQNLSQELPILQNTLFGWVISGKVKTIAPAKKSSSFYTSNEQHCNPLVS